MIKYNKTTKHWFALYTFSKAEKQVKKRLDEKPVINYLPLIRTPRVWSDRIKIIEVPLFRSYVFIFCTEAESIGLSNLKGVVKVIGNDRKPVKITQREIDAIHRFIEIAEGKQICEGSEVEVLVGAMRKIIGSIERKNKKYVYLRIKHLNAKIVVKIDNVALADRIT